MREIARFRPQLTTCLYHGPAREMDPRAEVVITTYALLRLDLELLFVRGWANKDVATKLNISEQQVANQKFDLLARLRTLLERQNLSADVFPELHEVEK